MDGVLHVGHTATANALVALQNKVAKHRNCHYRQNHANDDPGVFAGVHVVRAFDSILHGKLVDAHHRANNGADNDTFQQFRPKALRFSFDHTFVLCENITTL